jgi:hypothetical protein
MMKGLYREIHDDPSLNTAAVTDGHNRNVLPEAYYRERGYQPEFEKLPTREAFEKAAAHS